jgi:hypothetical protein
MRAACANAEATATPPRAISVSDSGKPINAQASSCPRRYLWHA